MNLEMNISKWTPIFLMFRKWLKDNMILLLLLPLTIISIIFINYGNVIDKVLLDNPEFANLFQLKSQLQILSSEIGIPSYIKCLGYNSVVFLIILFFTWLLTHSFFCYLQLSQQSGSKACLLFETIILLLIFIYIVSPKLPVIIVVLGYSALAAQIILIALYWSYYLKQK